MYVDVYFFSPFEKQILQWCLVIPGGNVYKNSGEEGAIRKWEERRKITQKAEWAKRVLQYSLGWDAEDEWAFILIIPYSPVGMLPDVLEWHSESW